MAYDTIFSKSFGKHEQKKLGYGAFFGCLIIALTLCTVFKPYLSPLRVLNLQLSFDAGLKMLMITNEIKEPQQPYLNTDLTKPVCDITRPRSDVCEINQEIRIHGNSSTIFVPSTENLEEINSWNVRPYARKGDNTAMSRVNQLTIKLINDSQILPSCSKNYTIPGIVFSTGGYAGNPFHDFSDTLIPLYINSRKFNGEVQFLVTDKHSWWINKYQLLLEKLSNYKIIDIDRETEVLCFPSMIVGLKAHKELSIDPSKSSYSMPNFTQLLRTTYSLPRARISLIPLDTDTYTRTKKRPRLLIISRKRTRRLTNADKVADMARGLGFEVVVQETNSNIPEVANFINSFDVMMGVHGAGFTNMIFLPENAIVLQIIPLGGIEWLARTDYKVPAEDMNLRYLEYKINVNESSLSKKYPLDHEVLNNPAAIYKRGYWAAFKKYYLDMQDVELDVIRFRDTLLKALELF